MTIQRLPELHKARPFRPFRVHLADGRNFRIDHPELVGYSPTGRTISIHGPDDSLAIVDLLLVTSLDLEQEKKRKGSGNGKSSKRRPD